MYTGFRMTQVGCVKHLAGCVWGPSQGLKPVKGFMYGGWEWHNRGQWRRLQLVISVQFPAGLAWVDGLHYVRSRLLPGAQGVSDGCAIGVKGNVPIALIDTVVIGDMTNAIPANANGRRFKGLVSVPCAKCRKSHLGTADWFAQFVMAEPFTTSRGGENPLDIPKTHPAASLFQEPKIGHFPFFVI